MDTPILAVSVCKQSLARRVAWWVAICTLTTIGLIGLAILHTIATTAVWRFLLSLLGG